MGSILTAEETLDPSFVPPRLVQRDRELELLGKRFRTSLPKGIPYHHLLTGGVGSGKTALAKRLAQDLSKSARAGGKPVVAHYVNCWRRSSDRTVLLELLRSVGVSLPDRGYGVPEMMDVFEQGLRRNPAHRLLILDEAGALVRQETKLVYLLTRSGEVGLGSISLFLVAPDDILPYLDAASRSSFGVTHRLQLSAYNAEDLRAILSFRAGLALRKGSYSADVLAQIAALAAPTGDARFALELLGGSAHLAEEAGANEIRPEEVRAAKGSIYPTLTESKLEDLGENELLALLAISRTLRGPRARTPTDRVREAYKAAAEEYGRVPVSRVTFWRTLRSLEREGIVQLESTGVGEAARVGMDEVPASYLTTVLETKFRRPSARKP
ncbi:MAG: AAA family ATPase [Thermoplasmata archaeon]|nr:AAA family ATPase [Thermoplasmata archaeon]